MCFKNCFVGMLLLGTLLFPSCGNTPRKTSKKVNIQSKEFQDSLVNANKMYVRRESDEIDQYVKHKGWNMIITGTGLRYMIIKKGAGPLAAEGQRAKLNYKKSLLDGTLCYSSDSTGPAEFTIGQDNVESGLHEAIQYMHVGDKAIFILPSHMAFGLMGDGNKIPPRASVTYELELISVK